MGKKTRPHGKERRPVLLRAHKERSLAIDLNFYLRKIEAFSSYDFPSALRTAPPTRFTTYRTAYLKAHYPQSLAVSGCRSTWPDVDKTYNISQRSAT